MDIILTKNTKVFILLILLLVLSTLNFNNLKDKAFIKLEKFEVSINNDLLKEDFGSRIQLKNLNIHNIKNSQRKMIREKIKIDSNRTFYIISNWTKINNNSEKIIKEVKKKIIDEYVKSFKKEKEKLQKTFISISLIPSKKNEIIIDKSKINEVLYLRKINESYLKNFRIGIPAYVNNNAQLDLIEEVSKVDTDIVVILKTYEEKEYLIFFALIFNQLIIFIILYFLYKGIKEKS